MKEPYTWFGKWRLMIDPHDKTKVVAFVPEDQTGLQDKRADFGRLVQVEDRIARGNLGAVTPSPTAGENPASSVLKDWLYLFDHRAMCGARLDAVVERARAALSPKVTKDE